MSTKSPVCWIGGKCHSASKIVDCLPLPPTYKHFVDVFGGGAHVLFRKPQYNHLETYNDYDGNLVNFWMQCRDHPNELQSLIDSLPYSRSLYEDWVESIRNGEELCPLERAARWFYVLRSSISGKLGQTKGDWGYSKEAGRNHARSLHNAAGLFTEASERMRCVQIECKSFSDIICRYQRDNVVFYCDPPYIGHERYYKGAPIFGLNDHKVLSELLNATKAKVALSYYPHPLLAELYPGTRWRIVTWDTYKHAEMVQPGSTRQKSTEILIMNYDQADARMAWS